jgi:hypothetical protein
MPWSGSSPLQGPRFILFSNFLFVYICLSPVVVLCRVSTFAVCKGAKAAVVQLVVLDLPQAQGLVYARDKVAFAYFFFIKFSKKK